MEKFVTVAQLIKDINLSLKLHVIAGKSGLDRKIHVSDLNRLGLALTGNFIYFPSERVQIIGLTEVTHIRNVNEKVQRERINKIFRYRRIPCIIASRNLEICPYFIEMANKKNIPLLLCKIPTTKLISVVTNYLEDKFSQEISLHGTLLDIFGAGVLILGETGVGKSETALELVDRGHRLVADDVVYISKRARKGLFGRGPELIRHHMEIRGIGIIDIRNIFGVAAIRNSKGIDLVINLEVWRSNKEYERLGLDPKTCSILGIKVPNIIIPVRPGRNIATLVEVAALNERLKRMGYYTARQLNKRLIKKMTQKK